jgi:hypothetical protein
MTPMPGNVNNLRHEDIHPEGAEYEHQDYPLAVYHRSKKTKNEAGDEIPLSKTVSNDEELKAASSEGYAPVKAARKDAPAAE